MVDDNLILCKKTNSEKCISDELFRSKKYLTYALFMIEAYNEDDDSVIISQLIIVIIKIFTTIFLLYVTKVIFCYLFDDFLYWRLNLNLIPLRTIIINQEIYNGIIIMNALIFLNLYLTGVLFYLRT